MSAAPSSSSRARAVLDGLAAAAAHAEAAGTPVVIAMVDAGGRLIGQLAMPGAFLASNDYAEWKAWTAASFAMPTLEFSAFLQTRGEEVRKGLLAHDKVTALSGGLPIKSGETLLGAVGVSGGPAEVDEGCAAAACEAFLAAMS